ncbi:ATP-binding protein [bacterium]|nr:ATP-binding protein [bacterium]MBU1959318.1 ATP-binding protein [bacterium]
MTLKKLPIGIQTFSKIREDDYIYIDKTKEALELIENYSYTFLSRPRRFGKSLFLDTLHNIFEGKKALFEGLYIYDKWDWETTYPVIKISWDGNLQTTTNLEKVANDMLQENQKRLGIECEENENLSICFLQLIRETYRKYNQKVVILIDEYDRPILDTIDNLEQSKLNREFIKGMYSVMKGADAFIKFVFLTGVSKFSKASIFSGLNMLEDISLARKFGNICGYTQANIENEFLPYLNGVDLEELKAWYNGYNFLKDDVYNPFDLLKFIKNEYQFSNYWFSSGTPTFLIKLIEQNHYFLPKLSNMRVGEQILDSFDIENINLEVILYQSGYLTIDKMQYTPFETIEYTLKLPNKEVKISFNDMIINHITKNNFPSAKTDIYMALLNGDLDKFRETFDAIFALIPYNNYTKSPMSEYEGFYASIIYVYLQSLGLDIIGEDVTNHGRIDLTVKIDKYIYIIEFKVGTQNALAQIKAKNYAQKYLNDGKEIVLVGINFDKQEKNISGFEWERVG